MSDIERKELQTKPDFTDVAVQVRPECQEVAVQNSPDNREMAVQTQSEATNTEMAGRLSIRLTSHASILLKGPLLESLSIVKLCIAHSHISQATFVE